jgi:hypothetical protein
VEACLLGALDPDQQPVLLDALARVGDALAGLAPPAHPMDTAEAAGADPA